MNHYSYELSLQIPSRIIISMDFMIAEGWSIILLLSSYTIYTILIKKLSNPYGQSDTAFT